MRKVLLLRVFDAPVSHRILLDSPEENHKGLVYLLSSPRIPQIFMLLERSRPSRPVPVQVSKPVSKNCLNVLEIGARGKLWPTVPPTNANSRHTFRQFLDTVWTPGRGPGREGLDTLKQHEIDGILGLKRYTVPCGSLSGNPTVFLCETGASKRVV